MYIESCYVQTCTFKKSCAFINVIVDIQFESMLMKYKYMYTCVSLLLKDISKCVSDNTEVNLESTTETKGHSANFFG